jgi:hypothetical protein
VDLSRLLHLDSVDLAIFSAEDSVAASVFFATVHAFTAAVNGCTAYFFPSPVNSGDDGVESVILTNRLFLTATVLSVI